MTAVTVVSNLNNSLTPERPIVIANITVTSDYTYAPSVPTGKTIKVISCYNNTDGAIVKVTNSSNTLTLGNGQSLSGEDCVLMYTYV